MKQAWACLFGALMLSLLLATYFFYPHDAALARYDFLFLAALFLQVSLLGFGLETIEEAKVHRRLPRGRNGDGNLQDLRRLLDLS